MPNPKRSAQTAANLKAMLPDGKLETTKNAPAALDAATQEMVLESLRRDVLPAMSTADRLILLASLERMTMVRSAITEEQAPLVLHFASAVESILQQQDIIVMRETDFNRMACRIRELETFAFKMQPTDSLHIPVIQ